MLGQDAPTMDNNAIVGPDYLYNMFMGQDHIAIINGAADFVLLDYNKKSLLREFCKQKFLIAWSINTLTDNPEELSKVFDYLYNGSPVFRLFQMAYGTSNGIGEVRLDLYDYAAYMYRMFANLRPNYVFPVRKENAE